MPIFTRMWLFINEIKFKASQAGFYFRFSSFELNYPYFANYQKQHSALDALPKGNQRGDAKGDKLKHTEDSTGVQWLLTGKGCGIHAKPIELKG